MVARGIRDEYLAFLSVRINYFYVSFWMKFIPTIYLPSRIIHRNEDQCFDTP